ncbi:helix-turn-helix domain-containing protein [Loigolactobacillus coryniformis]|nr:helix-turn-helix domain-containing protein [Bacillota bacterium]
MVRYGLAANLAISVFTLKRRLHALNQLLAVYNIPIKVGA